MRFVSIDINSLTKLENEPKHVSTLFKCLKLPKGIRKDPVVAPGSTPDPGVPEGRTKEHLSHPGVPAGPRGSRTAHATLCIGHNRIGLVFWVCLH